MEPLEIYYRVLAGLFVFVLVFWVLYRFGPKLTPPRKLTKEEIEEKRKSIQEKHMAFLNKNDKTVSVFLNTFICGVPLLIGMSFFNAHAKSDVFSFSTIQLLVLASSFTFGAFIETNGKTKNLFSKACDLGLLSIYIASILFCALELFGVKEPHIFGSPVPKILAQLCAFYVTVFIMFFIINMLNEKKRTALNQKIKRTS